MTYVFETINWNKKKEKEEGIVRKKKVKNIQKQDGVMANERI